MSCRAVRDITQVHFDVSLQLRCCCLIDQWRQGCPERLGPWLFVGAGAAKWQRSVSWQLSPEPGSSCSLFPLPPTYSSFTSPTAVLLAFHPLGVKRSSECSLPSWPINSRKTQGQIMSLGWVCSPPRCYLGMEPCMHICPRCDIYVTYYSFKKIFISNPDSPWEFIKHFPIYFTFDPYKLLQEVGILIQCTDEGHCQTQVVRSLPKS